VIDGSVQNMVEQLADEHLNLQTALEDFAAELDPQHPVTRILTDNAKVVWSTMTGRCASCSTRCWRKWLSRGTGGKRRTSP